MEQLSDRALVVEFSKELKTLLVETNRVRISGQVRGSGENTKRTGSQPDRKLARTIEELGRALGSLGRGVSNPEALERNREFQSELGITRSSPVERGTEVVALGQARRKIERLVVVLTQMRFGSNREHPLRVSVPTHRGFPGALELLERELADRLEHPESLLVQRPVRRRTRLLSSSEASVSRSASQTASADSSVHPPRNTDRRRKSTFSSSARRSYDQAIVARSVA